MSLSSIIRARTCCALRHQLPKQISSHTASITTYSVTSLLAQSARISNSAVNYATAATANTNQSDTTKWITIYRLPMARLVASFQRLKLYQGALTAFALPISFSLSQFEVVSPTAVVVVGAIGASGLITLSLFSLLARNVVGFIYINEECDKLKLAYVDYWGKRCDTFVDIDDLDIDWEKARPTPLNLYQNIRLYSDKKQAFKMVLTYGVIVEPDTFAGIFGE